MGFTREYWSSMPNPRKAAVRNAMLMGSYFTLGMGLFAPLASLHQSMDYVNAAFQEYAPASTMTTGYSVMYLAVLFAMCSSIEKTWNKKTYRMLGGYILSFITLVAMPVLDFIIIDHVKLAEHDKLKIAFSIWFIGSCLAGFSDALISTVAYGQAAAQGKRYTHAFIGGKSFAGVTMIALRCLSRAVLPQDDLLGMLRAPRRSIIIYMSVAAGVALLCVFIVGYVLPKLRKEIEELMARPGLTLKQALEVTAAAKQHARQALRVSADEDRLEVVEEENSFHSWGDSFITCSSSFPQDNIPTAAAAARSCCCCSGLGSCFRSCGSGLCSGLRRVGGALRPTGPDYSLTEILNEAVKAMDPRARNGGLPRVDKNMMSMPSDVGPVLTILADIEALGSSTSTSGDDEEFDGEFADIQLHDQARPVGTAAQQAAKAGAAKAASWLPGLMSEKTFSAYALSPDEKKSQTGSWLAFKFTWPYLLCLFISQLLVSAVLPLCMSKYIPEWPALGAWYLPVLLASMQVGDFFGTALLPVRHWWYPRIVLLVSVFGLFAFVPGYLLALRLAWGPPGLIALSSVLYLYSGYLLVSVFCLASHGLRSADAEVVQMLLVLAMATGYVIGGGLSWLWVLFG